MPNVIRRNRPSTHVTSVSCRCDLVPLNGLQCYILAHVKLSVVLASSGLSMEMFCRLRSRNRYCHVQEFVSGPSDSLHVVSPTRPNIFVKLVSVDFYCLIRFSSTLPALLGQSFSKFRTLNLIATGLSLILASFDSNV